MFAHWHIHPLKTNPQKNLVEVPGFPTEHRVRMKEGRDVTHVTELCQSATSISCSG